MKSLLQLIVTHDHIIGYRGETIKVGDTVRNVNISQRVTWVLSEIKDDAFYIEKQYMSNSVWIPMYKASEYYR